MGSTPPADDAAGGFTDDDDDELAEASVGLDAMSSAGLIVSFDAISCAAPEAISAAMAASLAFRRVSLNSIFSFHSRSRLRSSGYLGL